MNDKFEVNYLGKELSFPSLDGAMFFSSWLALHDVGSDVWQMFKDGSMDLLQSRERDPLTGLTSLVLYDWSPVGEDDDPWLEEEAEWLEESNEAEFLAGLLM